MKYLVSLNGKESMKNVEEYPSKCMYYNDVSLNCKKMKNSKILNKNQ